MATPTTVPLGEYSGSNATRELHQTIREFVVASDASTWQMLKLTWAMIWLTVVMLVLVVVQIALALIPLFARGQ